MFKQILCGATLLCTASFSYAGIIVQDFVVAQKRTSFTSTIDYNLFDNMGGSRILESVEFTLQARTSGFAYAENLTSIASIVNAELSTSISLTDLSNTTLASAAPSLTESVLLEAYDNTLDYSGPSGQVFLNLASTDFDAFTITDPASLMSYIGMGTNSVIFKANAQSKVTGNGNLAAGFSTLASGDVSVIYTFSELSTSVAEPTQVALLGLGLLSLVGFRKYKK